ncbi:MAG: DUF1045 domain-containing protein [Sulfitobacter sp.]
MYQRYAVFNTPQPGAFHDFGAAWLGWNSATGTPRDHPDFPDLNLDLLTKKPRPYGLHATLKAPFYLSPRCSVDRLKSAFENLCAAHKPVTLDALALVYQHGFIALRPTTNSETLMDLESAVVRTLDPCRAPLSQAALTKRRAARLTDRQDAHLLKWGYPYVMQDYQFHITLTGRLKPELAELVQQALAPRLAAFLAQPYRLDALSLMGEDENGFFHLIERRKLGL